MIARFSPLDLKDFPSARPANSRKRSQFKAPWSRTLELLDREFMNLGARDIVLQAGFQPGQLRIDGWPCQGARPSHPAVIVRFRDSEDRALSFPCDRFETHEENIRAIALSLEALRAVDRFGVTRHNEQYSGFKAIEAPKQWTVEDAAEFLIAKAGHGTVQNVLSLPELYRSLYRTTAGRLHPDRGGNPHEWKLLGDAKELLDLYHGLARNAVGEDA